MLSKAIPLISKNKIWNGRGMFSEGMEGIGRLSEDEVPSGMRLTEYSELEEIHKDHKVQLSSE